MQAVLSWKIDNSTYAYIQQIDGSYISGRLDSDSNEWLSLVSAVSAMTATQYRSAFDAMSAALSGMGISVAWSDSYFDNEPVNDIILLDSSGGGSDGSVTYEVLEEEINQVKIDVLNEVNNSLDTYLQNNIQNTVQEIVNQNNAEMEERLQDMQNNVDAALKELENLQSEMEKNLQDATDALEKASELFDLGDDISADDLKAAISASTYLADAVEEFSAATIAAITSITDEIDEVLMKAESAITAIDTVVGNVNFMQQVVTTLSGVCSNLSGMCSSLSAIVTTYSTRISNLESDVAFLSGATTELSASVISLSASTVVISGNLSTLRNEYDTWMALHNQFIVNLQASADTIYGIIEDYRAALNREGLQSNLFNSILDDVEECVNKVVTMEATVNQLNALVLTFDARITELSGTVSSMPKIVLTANTPSSMSDNTVYFIIP